MKDGKMHAWDTSKKEGVTMAFDISDVNKNVPQAGQIPGQNPGDFMKELEQYKKYCHSATVADSLFVIPTDIKFTDLTSMMKDAQKMMPSGAAVNPSTAAQMQEQMKQFQQKYQTPQGTPTNQ